MKKAKVTLRKEELRQTDIFVAKQILETKKDIQHFQAGLILVACIVLSWGILLA